MRRVSQFILMSQLGFEPSRPIGPVTNGRSSGTTDRPSSALAIPAPSSSSFPYSEFLLKEGAARGVQIDLNPKQIGIRYPMEVHLQTTATPASFALRGVAFRRRCS